MDLIFPDAGLVEQILDALAPGVIYNLFTNNITPSLADVAGSYTAASWSGYSPVMLVASDFTLNGVTGHNGYAIAAPISFGNSSGSSQNAYGYFVVSSTSGKLLAAARFDSAPVVTPNGGTCVVVPTWGNASQLAS